MKFYNIVRSSFFQIVSLFFVVGYLLGILNIYFSDKNNFCVMTYMYEYPQFVRITFDENKIFPQYGLYAYSEGRFTERTRKMWFDGIPVLFLPGNSGSHMQARSIASVALRKALSREYGYHFDFFTISFNEELSGLYGGVLQSQTQFAAASVSRILSLYKSNKYTKSVPSSVILIGHSMGGLIAKRLLAYSKTINTTNIAIMLAAPLSAPVVNFDPCMNNYYMLMNKEWELIRNNSVIHQKKIVISIGSGPRDVLIPAGLTISNDSHVNALTTAIPGIWVTPDHVSMVWCKQLVMVINRFLFDIVDPLSNQITENRFVITSKARQYFKANRSMIFKPEENRNSVSMAMIAFWYEDNRRIYQISRPEIDRMTYLMIRLVTFPQNRFVAIESINVDDKDWIFGCNANQVHQTYRYCKEATSLSQLSRWTGAAMDFGKRKLATIQLHHIMEQQPDWTHVVVKVSPTNKPVVLNVDVNDLASRQLNVKVPSVFSFGKTVIKQETERESLYYELHLSGFNAVHQAYLLYVEPTSSCQTAQYHVSAEMHVPWVENNENYHYYTHLKRSPMKLRLVKSNPNLTSGIEPVDKVKVTILLDPQCTFTISISHSWYHRLAQLARNYTPLLVPYVAAIVLLAARSNLLYLKEHGSCLSMHSALMSEGVKPYYVLVFSRLGSTVLLSAPLLSLICENASWQNVELQYFTRSVMVLPVYMTALGVLNIAAATVLLMMVFSSQITHRLLFKIVWRGGDGLAEKISSGLQKVPMVVSVALVCAAPLSCGAASLIAGAAFYAFMLSKMYEEYLEDYVYRLMSKFGSKFCRMFKSKSKKVPETEISSCSENLKAIESTVEKSTDDNEEKCALIDNLKSSKDKEITQDEKESNENEKSKNEEKLSNDGEPSKNECNINNENNDIDEDLSNLNFHMMLFFLWMCVTIVNVPVLLTWARNFKYSIVLKPDTSYYTGLVMSACSTVVWQMNGPKKYLKTYDTICSILFAVAVILLAFGPFSLSLVNYGITCMFAMITIQQLCDSEITSLTTESKPITNESIEKKDKEPADEMTNSKDNIEDSETKADLIKDENPSNSCDECNENRIYKILKSLRDKLTLNENS